MRRTYPAKLDLERLSDKDLHVRAVACITQARRADFLIVHCRIMPMVNPLPDISSKPSSKSVCH